MRYGDWNARNRELYGATVNCANNTCTLNKWRTIYLQLIQKRMEKIGMFKGKDISIEMTKEELLEFATWAGKELERRLVVDFTTHTDEFNPCGKPHNNGDCNECKVIKENV